VHPDHLFKDKAQAQKVHNICTTAVNAFRILTIYLQTVLPKLVERAALFLNDEMTQWSHLHDPLLTHKINDYQPLLQRLDIKQVNKMTDTNEIAATEKATTALTPTLSDKITSDDVVKVDLREAKIAEAGLVEGADKLIRMKLDLGNGVFKQVFAGIK